MGVVVWRADEVLLIKRGREPYKGMWSIPGGKVHFGERLEDAAQRELLEETGVKARLAGLIDVFESIGEGGHYVMVDYAAHWIEGEPLAADDAADAQFVPLDQALERLSWDTTRDALRRSIALVKPSHSGRESEVEPAP